MNDYERKQAEKLAAQRYPGSRWPTDLVHEAFIAGYEAALDTVAPEDTAEDAMSHYTDPSDPFWQSNPEQADTVEKIIHRGATYKDGVQLDPNRPEPPFPGDKYNEALENRGVGNIYDVPGSVTKPLDPKTEAALDRWNKAHPDLYVAPPFPGGHTLDPNPWLASNGQRFATLEESRVSSYTIYFEPRDGYSQNPEDYE